MSADWRDEIVSIAPTPVAVKVFGGTLVEMEAVAFYREHTIYVRRQAARDTDGVGFPASDVYGHPYTGSRLQPWHWPR